LVEVQGWMLEMSVEQLCTRLLGDHSGVAADLMRRGEVNTGDFSRFEEVKKYLRAAPLFIDDAAALSVGGLRRRARRLKRTMPELGLIQTGAGSVGHHARAEGAGQGTRCAGAGAVATVARG
jgi:replicative DNA helicase